MCFSRTQFWAIPVFVFIVSALFFSCPENSNAQILRRGTFLPTPAVQVPEEPQWYPYVFARGEDRLVIQETSMVDRPYRPMHFYGNTVRRLHYRGNPAPLPRDVVRTTSMLIRRR